MTLVRLLLLHLLVLSEHCSQLTKQVYGIRQRFYPLRSAYVTSAARLHGPISHSAEGFDETRPDDRANAQKNARNRASQKKGEEQEEV